jgi:hypothetical protein
MRLVGGAVEVGRQEVALESVVQGRARPHGIVHEGTQTNEKSPVDFKYVDA